MNLAIRYPYTPQVGPQIMRYRTMGDRNARIVVLEHGQIVEVCILLVRRVAVRLPKQAANESVGA